MPARLRKAMGNRDSHLTAARSGAGEWSAFETLCHLRDATLVYAARFRWIIFNDDPFLPDYDENNWVARASDLPGDTPAMLDEIAASRADLVRVLSRLPDSGWQRTGRHEAMGHVVLEHYARHQVVHEEIHLDQIKTALGRS
jgi:hypothetical protein